MDLFCETGNVSVKKTAGLEMFLLRMRQKNCEKRNFLFTHCDYQKKEKAKKLHQKSTVLGNQNYNSLNNILLCLAHNGTFQWNIGVGIFVPAMKELGFFAPPQAACPHGQNSSHLNSTQKFPCG